MSDPSPPPPAPSAPPAPPPAVFDLSPETFLAVVYRRARYTVAILLTAALFWTLGWKVAAPPPTTEGVSLMAWQNHSLYVGFLLALMLLGSSVVCSLLVHPDSPHMGLFCALLGMAALSIRGGTIHLLVYGAQQGGNYTQAAQALTIECLQWAAIFLIAEVFTGMLHDQFLKNTHWITRTGPELGRDELEQSLPGSSAMGVSLVVSRTLRTNKLQQGVATPLAMIYSGAIAFLMLYVFMQSQAKGQVLFACFMAFFISTLLAYLAFPRVPIMALLVTVPLTAAVGYLWGMHGTVLYPGQATFFAMRALPIDYVTAGVPGGILGYYAAFRWALHSPEES